MSSASMKEVLYSEEYLIFGLLPAIHDERSPFCLPCEQHLASKSMKQGRLEVLLKA